jgi:hypothetical protein
VSIVTLTGPRCHAHRRTTSPDREAPGRSHTTSSSSPTATSAHQEHGRQARKDDRPVDLLRRAEERAIDGPNIATFIPIARPGHHSAVTIRIVVVFADGVDDVGAKSFSA